MLWSEQHALNIHPLKLCALCIGINNGAVNPDIENFSPLFSPEMLGESESINLMLRVGSLGRCLATLLSALSSNKLQSLPSLTISIADSPFSFSKDELLSVRDVRYFDPILLLLICLLGCPDNRLSFDFNRYPICFTSTYLSSKSLFLTHH